MQVDDIRAGMRSSSFRDTKSLGDPSLQSLLTTSKHMGVSQNWGYHFGGPNNKGYNIFGSILGSPYFGKLPHRPSTLESPEPSFNPQEVGTRGSSPKILRGLGFRV